MIDARKRLQAAVARAEQLAARNDAHGAMLRRAAGAMGDHATRYLEQHAATVASGDDARAQHTRAVRERFLARGLASA